MFGESIAHGTPFRRAWEDGCLIGEKVFQIELRGTGYSPADFDWSRENGWTVVQAEECWHKSLTPLMEKVRAGVGDAPVYISFDIDSLDPAYAPGTGTVEIGGLTTVQALEIVRGCAGLNLVGGDLVEVSPPFDKSGNTALIGANFCTRCSASFRAFRSPGQAGRGERGAVRSQSRRPSARTIVNNRGLTFVPGRWSAAQWSRPGGARLWVRAAPTPPSLSGAAWQIALPMRSAS